MRLQEAVGLGGPPALVSSCCAAPWAVTLFGTVVAAAMARLNLLQSYLPAAAALSIGGVFWLAHRQRPVIESASHQAGDRRLQALARAPAVALALTFLASRSPVA